MDDDTPNADDLFDDWLIKSLKSYRNLHMFELAQPTCVIEWNTRNGVCVAGCSVDTRNEILEMIIPAKLMASTSNSKAARLTKDRDFKVIQGGLCDKPIHCLKYLTGTSPRLIVTGSPASPDLDVWQLDVESGDVIEWLSVLPGGQTEGGGVRQVAERPGHQGQVVFGSTLSDMRIADVDTKKVISSGFGEGDSLVEVQFLNENELVVCDTQNGLINIHDLRTTSSQSAPSARVRSDSEPESELVPKEKDTDAEMDNISQSNPGLDTSVPKCTNQSSPKEGDASWTFDLNLASASDSSDGEDTVCKKARLDADMATVVRLCANGEVVVNDLRNLQESLHSVRLDNVHMQRGQSEPLTVKWCPTEKNLLSVSGLNGCIDIYDISRWQPSPSAPPTVQPIFSHEGHMMAESTNQKARILCHTWHPQLPRVLLSSGSDGSLHAWDWSDVL